MKVVEHDIIKNNKFSIEVVMKKQLIVILSFIVIITIGLIIAYKSVDYSDFSSENTLYLKPSDFTPDFSAQNFSKYELKESQYTLNIAGDAIKALGDNRYYLILNRLSDNAHTVYFNDVCIGAYGDYEGGNSNLWNGVFSYPISRNLIQEDNELRIETVSTYRSGLSTRYVYITGHLETSKIIGGIQFFGQRINGFLIGFIAFSSLIILIFYFLNGKEDPKYLYAALATLMTGIYYADYLVYGYINLSYFSYKKFILMNLFMGIGFYAYTIAAYYEKKIIKWLGHIIITITLLMVLFAPDMVVFKKWYSYAYILILINVFTWLFYSLKDIKRKFVAFIFTIGFMTLGIYGGITVWMDLTNSYFEMNSPVVYISVFSAIPLLLIYEAIQEKDLLLVREKNLREVEIRNSMTDGLTNTWNQRYMSMIFQDKLGAYSLAVVDIDDFKSINDTYGHLAGDFILTCIADIFKKGLSSDDIFCRYGGDEFVVIIKNQEPEAVYNLMDFLRKQIALKSFKYNDLVIRVTISIGLAVETGENTVESVFNEADKRLYFAKSNGRNQIATYELSF